MSNFLSVNKFWVLVPLFAELYSRKQDWAIMARPCVITSYQSPCEIGLMRYLISILSIIMSFSIGIYLIRDDRTPASYLFSRALDWHIIQILSDFTLKRFFLAKMRRSNQNGVLFNLELPSIIADTLIKK